jgi:hypothetical protein
MMIVFVKLQEFVSSPTAIPPSATWMDDLRKDLDELRKMADEGLDKAHLFLNKETLFKFIHQRFIIHLFDVNEIKIIREICKRNIVFLIWNRS